MRHAPVGLADILEKEWMHTVIDLAKQLAWARIYHTHDSRRSAQGFPDLVLVRDRVVYLELKREAGTVSAAQQEWIDALAYAGAEVYVARPRHLGQLARILTARGRPVPGEVLA